MNLWRQEAILPKSAIEDIRVVLVGVGGIGSRVAPDLTRMGVTKFLLIDPDTVEDHNRTSTSYYKRDIGKTKVAALAEELEAIDDETEVSLASTDWNAAKELYSPISGILISGLDDMTARQDVWNYARYNQRINLYIDGRMAAQVGRVLTAKPCLPDDVRAYEETLFIAEEAIPIPCTERAIIYNTSRISSEICKQVKRFLMGEHLPKEILFDMVNGVHMEK